MPEVIASPAPSAPAAPAVPAPAAPAAPAQAAPAAPAPEPSKGIAEAMKDFTGLGLSKPAAPPVKTDGAPPKPAEPDIWEKAPAKLKNEHFKLKRETEDRISSYERRIKEIEAKPREVPGDAKAIEQFQTQIKELQERLAAVDYRQSPDFQRDYVERWQNEYKNAAEEMKVLQFITKDAEGNQQTRPATEQDLLRVMRLPAGEQDRIISEVFGYNAPRVFARLLELQRIERAADAAIANHAKNAEQRNVDQRTKAQKETEAFDQNINSSIKELQTQWPEYFAPDEKDAEISGALQKGYDFVDNITKNAGGMTPDERAAHVAVLRARAAGFLSAILRENRLKAEVESLKTELKKYRKSDPGEGEAAAGGAPDPNAQEVPSGIAQAAQMFKPS